MAREEKEKNASYNDVLKDVRKGNVAPMYLLYGSEVFLADQLADAIVQAVFNAPKDDFNLHIFYGKEAPLDTVISTALGFPVMADRQVIILREADQWKLTKDKRDDLKDLFPKFPDTTVFIAIGSGIDVRTNPWAWMRKNGIAIEFKPLRENEIPVWIDQFLDERGKKITDQASLLLRTRVDLSLREVHNQIDKLCTYIGDRDTINEEDVEEAVGISRQYNIFEFCNAIGKRDLTKAMAVYEQMARFGGEPVYMIVMLTRHYHILLKMCEMRDQGTAPSQIQAVMMTENRIFPNFFQTDYWPQAQKHKTSDVKLAFRCLLQADIQLKSSAVDKDMLMQHLIYQLATSTAV
ncbi:DNA polymerase III subunit delta [bacterium]|nr:DNA polymerase III subunit delta [bacterium]NUN46769.1 DNA polymerase III subunit delta [bacterium]